MIYTNRDGQEITLQKLKPLLIKSIDQSYRKRTPAPAVPTYTSEMLGGETVELVHNEGTLETDAEKAEFAKYQEESELWDTGLNDLLLKAMILKGVVWDQEISDEWKEDQAFFGIEVPEDERDLRILYFENELVAHPDDLLDMMQAIMRLSGLSEEALSEAESLFRGDVQGAEDKAGDVA